MTEAALKRTPLHDLHAARGARMVPFAGYEMPVQYASGILKEHAQVRERAGLFDVSHMGQARLTGEDPAAALESLVSGDLQSLDQGQQKYTVLLNEEGGIMDDLMVSRPDADGLFLVVNAATKDADFAHIERKLQGRARLEPLGDRALLALQGPAAAKVMNAVAPGAADLVFMLCGRFDLFETDATVSRSGYTGEDGFEISVPASRAREIAEKFLAFDDVEPIGLGARDSLRLEAGLCLYGHDIDETTSPVEASLLWALPRSRRERGDFPGAKRILEEIESGPGRKRVGLRLRDRAPAREGAKIADASGEVVGTVTSGGVSPTLGYPIAMGYVPPALARPGTELDIIVRGTPRPAEVVKTPFVPQNYHRG